MENRQDLVQNIVKALSCSLNPNNQIRQQAELFIKQVHNKYSNHQNFIGRKIARLRSLSFGDLGHTLGMSFSFPTNI
jgi:hypothetical protein